MSGDSWRGEKDPAIARSKAFEQVQVTAAAVEKASKRRDDAQQELHSAQAELKNAQDAYEKARTELEYLMPEVREPPEMHPT